MSEPATYSSQAIANRFLELAEGSGVTLSNMQLQKLVFLAHGFHLGLKGQPLTNQDVHAWEWGPVIPVLYKRLRKFGNGPVRGRLEAEDKVLPDTYPAKLIERVWERYGRMSAAKLSTLTHLSDSPWDVVWNQRGDKFGIIEPELIESHYADRLKNA